MNSHGFTCVPHPDPPSPLPLHLLPLGFPSAPGPSSCLMHPTSMSFWVSLTFILSRHLEGFHVHMYRLPLNSGGVHLDIFN